MSPFAGIAQVRPWSWWRRELLSLALLTLILLNLLIWVW